MKKARGATNKGEERFAYGSLLETVSQGLYHYRMHILREFVQNGYDALADLRKQQPNATLAPIEITVSPPSITIADRGLGMSADAIRRYRYLGFSGKDRGTHAGFRGIGKFSAIGVCSKIIVSSSRLGDAKRCQVVINAADMFQRLQKNKNVPLEDLLREHSDFSERPEKPSQHYTFVELHGIRGDAADLLDVAAIKSYLVRVAPLPLDPSYAHAKEIRDRLYQVIPGFLEVDVLVDGQAIYKKFLENGIRPAFEPIFEAEGPTNPIAFCWYCQHAGKGQFRETTESGTRGHRRPDSGLIYRSSNFAVGDGNLTRETLWDSTPERAFYFFGEIHVLDTGVIPTSARDNCEDTPERKRLFERCKSIATTLSFEAGLQSQQQRFGEVVDDSARLVAQTEATLKAGSLAVELKEERTFQIQKVLEDVKKRLKQSSRLDRKDARVEHKAKQVLRRAERLKRELSGQGSGQFIMVDIVKELAMDSRTKAIYDSIIGVIKEEFRDDTARFEALVKKIHDALRKGIPC